MGELAWDGPSLICCVCSLLLVRLKKRELQDFPSANSHRVAQSQNPTNAHYGTFLFPPLCSEDEGGFLRGQNKISETQSTDTHSCVHTHTFFVHIMLWKHARCVRAMCVFYIRTTYPKISARINVSKTGIVGGFSTITAVSSYTFQ